MSINQIIMYFMSFGVLLGGTDRILGNRFGFGEKFESGFRMLGPVGLSMAGIICLAPLLSLGLGGVIKPLCSAVGIDPAILGSLLAIDMGGYVMATELASDPVLGQFFGLIVSATFGCTIVFSIPVGVGFISHEDRPLFTRGILLGLAALPCALITGGLMLGISIGTILLNSLPILLISVFLAIGVIMIPDRMMKGFQVFARIIQIIATFGLMVASVTHLTGIQIVPGMPPLLDAMKTVSSICIVMLGSMPLAELVQRILKKPFAKLEEHTGLNGASSTGLLLGLFTATPALAMIPDMDKRGKVVVSACLVSCVCVLGAHFAFTTGVHPELVPAVLASKFLGGIVGGGIAMVTTRNMKP